MSSEDLIPQSSNSSLNTRLNSSNQIPFSNISKSSIPTLVKMSPLFLQKKEDSSFYISNSTKTENSINDNCTSFSPSIIEKKIPNENPLEKFVVPIISNSYKKNSNDDILIKNNFFKSDNIKNDKAYLGKINTFLFLETNLDNRRFKEKKDEKINLSNSNLFINPNINKFQKSLNYNFPNTKKNEVEEKEDENQNFNCEYNKTKSDKKPRKYFKKINTKKFLSSLNGTHVTNVTNNYFIQVNNQLIGRKRGRKPVYGTKRTKPRKIKKKDKTTMSFQLNQISINGYSISKFPVISIKEEDLYVDLLLRMLNETNYFKIVDKYCSNIPVLDEKKYNKSTTIKLFKKEKDKIHDLYLIDDNINENNPIKLIYNFYRQIKNTVLQIQKNYIGKKKNSLNIEQCQNLEKLIRSCNEITNIVTDYKKSGIKKKNKSLILHEDPLINTLNKENFVSNSKSAFKSLGRNKQKHFKTYLCEFCNKAYSNGQGLGGHISRIHPNQSYKYKDKIRIRNERTAKRKRLLDIKRKLFKKYSMDYDYLIERKEKNKIQKFLQEHKDEYRHFKKLEQKREKDINNNINNSNVSIKESSKSDIAKRHIPNFAKSKKDEKFDKFQSNNSQKSILKNPIINKNESNKFLNNINIKNNNNINIRNNFFNYINSNNEKELNNNNYFQPIIIENKILNNVNDNYKLEKNNENNISNSINSTQLSDAKINSLSCNSSAQK